MNYKKTLSRYTGNYRTLDKKILSMKKSWDDIGRTLENVASGKRKKTDTKNKK